MDKNVEKILKLPNKQKVIILLAVCILLGGVLFYLLHFPKVKELKTLNVKLAALRGEIKESKSIADNLPKFKSDYEQLKKDLESALTELPNQKEIPTLLTSITSAGKGVGLDFLAFRPKPEEPKDFYAAVPVEITVSGTFIGVANFFVAVSNLPRIVNIDNVNFSDIKDVGGKMMVKVNCLATTFRFIDKKETKDEKKGK